MLKKKIYHFICELPVLRGIFKRIKANERKIKKTEQRLTKMAEAELELKEAFQEYQNSFNSRAADLDQNIENLKKQIDLLVKENHKLEEQNRKLNDVMTALENKLEHKLENKSEEFHAEIRKLNETDERIDKKNQNIDRRLSRTEREFDKKLHYYFTSSLEPEKYKEALTEWYNTRMEAHMDLDHPVTLNEKIQWLKLNDSTPEKTMLADKNSARSWVTDRIGDRFLIPVLGVYKRFEDISFDELPDQFVMKANHGSGWNIVVEDKNKLDPEDTRKKFNRWMNMNFAFTFGLELHYKNIDPVIVIEKYQPCKFEYQFWCFNGKPEFVSVISKPHGANKKITYDLNWNKLDFVTSLPRLENELEKPDKFEEMTELVKKLCKDFLLVRVDLFYDDGQIYFNELTFTPGSGTMRWDPPEYDKYWGERLELPEL